MGLMDRDYYREKPRGSKRGPLDWIKDNPLVAGVIVLLLILLILYLI